MDEVLIDKTSGSPILVVRIKDSKGVWLAFKQVHTLFLDRHNRQTLASYLDRMEDSVRNASLVEKDYLCVKGAIKTRAAKVALVKLDCVCNLVRKVTNNDPLVLALAEIPGKAAHKIQDGTELSMRTVQSIPQAGPGLPPPPLFSAKSRLAMLSNAHNSTITKQGLHICTVSGSCSILCKQ